MCEKWEVILMIASLSNWGDMQGWVHVGCGIVSVSFEVVKLRRVIMSWFCIAGMWANDKLSKEKTDV